MERSEALHVRFVAGFGPIVGDPAASRELYGEPSVPARRAPRAAARRAGCRRGASGPLCQRAGGRAAACRSRRPARRCRRRRPRGAEVASEAPRADRPSPTTGSESREACRSAAVVRVAAAEALAGAPWGAAALGRGIQIAAAVAAAARRAATTARSAGWRRRSASRASSPRSRRCSRPWVSPLRRGGRRRAAARRRSEAAARSMAGNLGAAAGRHPTMLMLNRPAPPPVSAKP